VEIRVAELDEVQPDDMLAVTAGDREILIARVGTDEYYAVDNMCSHADAWMDTGTLWPSTCEVECPLHDGRFDLRTGKPTQAPCVEPIQSFAVAVRDAVYVEVPD